MFEFTCIHISRVHSVQFFDKSRSVEMGKLVWLLVLSLPHVSFFCIAEEYLCLDCFFHFCHTVLLSQHARKQWCGAFSTQFPSEPRGIRQVLNFCLGGHMVSLKCRAAKQQWGLRADAVPSDSLTLPMTWALDRWALGTTRTVGLSIIFLDSRLSISGHDKDTSIPHTCTAAPRHMTQGSRYTSGYSSKLTGLVFWEFCCSVYPSVTDGFQCGLWRL